MLSRVNAGVSDRLVAVIHNRHTKAWPENDSLPLEIVSLDYALTNQFKDDAHCVIYVAGKEGEKQPRLRKTIPERYPVDPLTYVLFADVDNAGHRKWLPGELESLDIKLETEGFYSTSGGFRLVQPLDAPISSYDIEPYIQIWWRSLRSRGFDVDPAPKTWTSLFRLPYVTRDGREVAPRCDFSQMQARTIELERASISDAPTFKRAPRKRAEAPRSFTSVLHPDMSSLARRMGLARGHAPGDRHAISMAMSGALCERGFDLAIVPAIVREAMTIGGSPDPEKTERNARDTIERWTAGGRVMGTAKLVRSFPGIAEALMWKPKAPQKPIELPIVNGVSAIATPCGAGKTTAALALAMRRMKTTHKHGGESTRAPLDSKTAIAFPTNRLANQSAALVRADGGAVRLVRGVLALQGHDKCQFSGVASAIEKGGLSINNEFCEGRGIERCEFYDSCKARIVVDEDDGARISMGSHSMVSALSDWAGSTGLLIIDEAIPVLETVKVSPEHIDTAVRYLDTFVMGWVTPMRPILAAIQLWSTEGVVPDLAALARDAPSEKLLKVTWSHMRRAKNDKLHADAIGTAANVARRIVRALALPAIGLAIVTGGEVIVTSLAQDVVDALNRPGSTVLMGADIELYLPMYEKVVGYAIPLTKVGVVDGCAVDRTWLRTSQGTRSSWCPRDGRAVAPSFGAAVRRAMAWADGRSVGLVTFLDREGDLAKEAARWTLPGQRVEVGHYGGLRGLNSWADLACLATIGDPRPNVGECERESEFAEEPEGAASLRVQARAASDLEQAHGRLRTVHREVPASMLHIGGVRPSEAGWEPVEPVPVPTGPGDALGYGEGTLRGMVAGSSVRQLALQLGVRRDAISRLCKVGMG